MDVAEQKIATLVPPDRTFGWAVGTSESGSQFLVVFLGTDNFFHCIGQIFNRHKNLLN
jgi:hypothetical protein